MIYFTRGDSQPLLRCRKLFLTLLEFSLHFGKLAGVLIQLLPGLGKLGFLTLNHLILRLKLFEVSP